MQDATYDPVGPTEGPSDRFYDVIKGAKLLERGYTFVMVDIRGFGGSNGCLDWGGPGEQSDVVASVNWLASRPWSNGRVGMYGKSYDGVTGLVGVNKRPAGLKAVIAQEPVYDLYRYLYGDGIRRLNSARHARALQPDRAHARAGHRQPALQRERRRRRRAPRLQRAEPARPDRPTTTTARPTGCRAT